MNVLHLTNTVVAEPEGSEQLDAILQSKVVPVLN
jgi:hypothetical protein